MESPAYVCLSVSLSVCLSVSISLDLIWSSDLLCMLPMVLAWSSSGGFVIRYVFFDRYILLVLWMMSYLHLMGHVQVLVSFSHLYQNEQWELIWASKRCLTLSLYSVPANCKLGAVCGLWLPCCLLIFRIWTNWFANKIWYLAFKLVVWVTFYMLFFIVAINVLLLSCVGISARWSLLSDY